MDSSDLRVTKLGGFVRVTAEQLLDAGIPLPPGMELPPRPPLYRRWRWAALDAVRRGRERVGFWIAGVDPDDLDW
ncbi:hypothetical protein [Streptomyces bungoensis]|uniref:hypothetical protein n=1 Tax=Streptomyces bungoensis TaxID=285568 RepID=UPI0034161D4F